MRHVDAEPGKGAQRPSQCDSINEAVSRWREFPPPEKYTPRMSPAPYALGSFSVAGCPPFAGLVAGDRVVAVAALAPCAERADAMDAIVAEIP